MLVLTIGLRRKLLIGDDIVIQLLELSRKRARVGIEAPPHVRVMRPECVDKTDRHTPEALDVIAGIEAGEPLHQIEARHDRSDFEADQMSKPLFTVQEFKYLQQVVANLREENTLLRAEIQNREHIQ